MPVTSSVANWIESANYDIKTNDISVVTRYPEDMKGLVKAFKKNRVEDYLQKTKRLLKWLKKDGRLKK